MSGDLIDTTEMYLRTVIELEEEGITPLRARIAERLEQSSPTVSQTVSRMERDGLLHVHDDRRIELSELGRARGLEVMRRHRLAERFLVEILQMPLATVHEEACRWEHVLSEASEQRMFALLKEPTSSPYGTPIPHLEPLGYAQDVEPFLAGVHRLSESTAAQVVIRRLSENVQRDAELLSQLVDAGVVPGVECERSSSSVGIKLSTGGGHCTVSHEDAADIFVSTP